MNALQGKAELSTFGANIPSDAELLDIKLDLFSKQVFALIRSDSFEDVTESQPIPEINLIQTANLQTATPKPASSIKLERTPIGSPKPTPEATKKLPQAQKSQHVSRIENEFSPDQRKLLSFKLEGDFVVVKPVQFLKAEWEDINEVVRSLDGKWVKGDILSYWMIPLQ